MEFFSVGFIFNDVQKYFSNHFWGDRPRCPLYSLFRIKMQPVRLFCRYPNFQRSAGYAKIRLLVKTSSIRSAVSLDSGIVTDGHTAIASTALA